MIRRKTGKRSGKGRESHEAKRYKPETEDKPEDTWKTERESDTEWLLTPPEGVATVDVGTISTRLAHLAIEDRTSVGRPAHVETSSPKSRQRGTLERRVLFENRANCPSWSVLELKALVSYLADVDESKWTSHKGDDEFWDKAARFVQRCTETFYCRTGWLINIHITGYVHVSVTTIYRNSMQVKSFTEVTARVLDSSRCSQTFY